MRSFKIEASEGSPIPAAYSAASSQSLIAQNVPAGVKEVVVNNQTSQRIAFCVTNSSSAPTADVEDVYLEAGENHTLVQAFGPNGKVYLRSDSGSAIESGRVLGYWKEAL